MSEHQLRRLVTDLLTPLGAFPVENSSMDGTPDVCTTLGWIELKKIDAWPARRTTNVFFDLRNSQRIWINRWTRANGRSWVIAQVAREMLIWTGSWAAQHLDVEPRTVLLEHAVACWAGRPNSEQLIQAIAASVQRTIA